METASQEVTGEDLHQRTPKSVLRQDPAQDGNGALVKKTGMFFSVGWRESRQIEHVPASSAKFRTGQRLASLVSEQATATQMADV